MFPGLVLVALWAPPLALAQAEAAPPRPTQAVPTPLLEPEPPPPPPESVIGLSVGLVRRLDPAAEDIPPAYGFAVGTTLCLGYATLTPSGIELSAAARFFYQRHARDVTITRVVGNENVTFDATRTVSHYDFVVEQVVARPFGRLRPYLLAGIGVGLGYFSSLEEAYAPGESRATRGIGHAAVGLDLAAFSPETRLGLEVGYTYVLRPPTFVAADGARLSIFGSRLLASFWFSQTF